MGSSSGISLRWRLAAVSSILGTFLLAGSATAFALDANKTTSSLGGTTSIPTPMTGNLSLSGTTTGTTYTLVDAFQALPSGGANKDRYYQGAYTISFSNCTGGTANGSVETISSNGVYPGGPPPNNTSPPSYQASGSSVSCDYSITFSGTAPAGTIVSVKNDVWVLVGGTLVTQTAGPSVTPPFGSPPVVPEAGLPALLPLAGLLLLGVVVARRRRLASG
jgi:hypothetical protein